MQTTSRRGRADIVSIMPVLAVLVGAGGFIATAWAVRAGVTQH